MSATYPLDAIEVVDGAITVDLMLNEPQRITRYVSDLAAKQLFAGEIFTADRAVGGAIIFDQLTKNDIQLGGAAEIPAGGEFPILSAEGDEPQVARVKKTGGKVKVTDEARKRNNQALLQRELRKLTNTIVVDLDSTALTVLDDAHTALGSDALKVESGGWETAGKATSATKTAANSVRADILRAKAAGSATELGYVYNRLILHDEDWLNLQIAMESDANVQAFLASNGLTVISSPRATKGTPKLVAGQTVGVMGIEDPLSTETYDDRKIQSTWTQSWVTAAFAVTDPLAIVEIENASA